MTNPNQNGVMRNVGRKTVPERPTAGPPAGRQRPSHLFGPMTVGSPGRSYQWMASRLYPSMPRYPQAIFQGIAYREARVIPAVLPHAMQAQSRGVQFAEQNAGQSMNDELLLSSVARAIPPNSASPPVTVHPRAMPGDRTTVNISQPASQPHKATPTPTYPTKRPQVTDSARRALAGKQPRHPVDKHRVNKAPPARPSAKRGQTPIQTAQRSRAHSTKPSADRNKSLSPDAGFIPSTEAPPTQSTRSTRRHAHPDGDLPARTPDPTPSAPQITTVNGFLCTVDPQTGSPVASTYGPYAVSPQLHGIRLALGEANWEDYITLVEALETGHASEADVSKKENAMFLCDGKGVKKKIRGMVRDMVLSGLGRTLGEASTLT